MLELILFRNGTEIDEVSLGQRAFDGADAESQFIITGRQLLHDVFRFPPARRLLRRQGDELFLVQVVDRQI